MYVLRGFENPKIRVYYGSGWGPGAKTIKKNTNSTQNKTQTHRAKQYEVTSFLSTDCELSTETCSKNVCSLGPRCHWDFGVVYHVHSVCIYLLKGVSHYDVCVLSMSVMGFKKKLMEDGWVG